MCNFHPKLHFFRILEQCDLFLWLYIYIYCISHEMSDDMDKLAYIRAMNDEIKQLESKLNELKNATHIPANLDALSMKQRYYIFLHSSFIFRSMFLYIFLIAIFCNNKGLYFLHSCLCLLFSTCYIVTYLNYYVPM